MVVVVGVVVVVGWGGAGASRSYGDRGLSDLKVQPKPRA
jgi:hypothetical protein